MQTLNLGIKQLLFSFKYKITKSLLKNIEFRKFMEKRPLG
jgi:hypothetical protein